MQLHIKRCLWCQHGQPLPHTKLTPLQNSQLRHHRHHQPSHHCHDNHHHHIGLCHLQQDHIRERVAKEGRKGGHQYINYLWTQHPQRPTLVIPPAVLSNIAKYILLLPNLKCVSNIQVNTDSRSGVHPHAFNTPPPQTCAVGQSIFISKIKAGSIYITSIITIGYVAIRTQWSSITIIAFEGFPFHFAGSTDFFLFVQNLAFLMSQYLDDDDNVVLPSEEDRPPVQHLWWWWCNDNDDDIVVLPSEEDRPAVRRLYLNAIEMSLRCRTPNIPLYTAAQSFYSGQTCFLASSAIFVPVQTICMLYPTSHWDVTEADKTNLLRVL